MIICKNCGGELPDGAKFCTKCGYAIWNVEGINDEPRAAEPAEAAPAYDDWNAQAQPQSSAPQYNPYPDNSWQGGAQYPSNQTNGYPENASYDPYRGNASPDHAQKNAEGRTAMILAIIGVVLSELGIPGIILSAIAKGKVKAWEQKYGPATGMAKAAKIISTVGLILSIFMTVFWVLYFFIIVGLIAAGRSGELEEILEDLFNL